MTVYTAANAEDGRIPVSASQAGIVCANKGVFETTASLETDDLIILCKVPAEHTILNAYLDCDDLDSGSALVLTAGQVNAGKTALEAVAYDLMTDETVAQAGGRKEMDLPSQPLLGPSSSERFFGVQVDAGQGGAEKLGTISLTILYTAQEFGV